MYTRAVNDNAKYRMAGFMAFIRKQGVAGLAIGFLLGGAVSKMVTALITDIVNPFLGLILGSADGLKAASIQMGSVVLPWGDFVSSLLDFLVIAAVVYYGVKLLGIEEVIEKKSDKKVK